jgi:hypothetical protein
MFPQIPAKLPPAITKDHDVAEFIMSKHMESYSSRGVDGTRKMTP